MDTAKFNIHISKRKSFPMDKDLFCDSVNLGTNPSCATDNEFAFPSLPSFCVFIIQVIWDKICHCHLYSAYHF